MYDVVSRRQRRKNRIVKKLTMGDNRRESIVEKLPMESEAEFMTVLLSVQCN